MGRMWVSCHHCFIVCWCVPCFSCMVFLLSKPAWFCGEANLLSQVIINLQGSPIFFYLQAPSGINYLIIYLVPLLCPYQSYASDTLAGLLDLQEREQKKSPCRICSAESGSTSSTCVCLVGGDAISTPCISSQVRLIFILPGALPLHCYDFKNSHNLKVESYVLFGGNF